MRIEKVRDHCLRTGEYRGAAHVVYILYTRQSFSNYLPVAFYNLDCYDAHLFLNQLIKQRKEEC